MLMISEAVERDDMENLDNPEEIIRHHLEQKTICIKSLDLLFKEIPPDLMPFRWNKQRK